VNVVQKLLGKHPLGRPRRRWEDNMMMMMMMMMHHHHHHHHLKEIGYEDGR